MLFLEIARGIRIALPPDPRHISTYVFLEQEDWFEDEAAFVGRVAEPGGRMLDVGASFGFYSLNYARAAGAASKVWAFEPTPDVCEFVRESVRLNDLPNISLLETAVGAESGRARLVAGADSEINSLDPARGSLDVALAPLDSLDREHGFGAVDFVKLDVEGHEAAVVAGGTTFFTRESPLVMLEVKAESALDFSAASRLENLGYALYRLVPALGVLVPFHREQPDFFLLNIFACKPDCARRLGERGLLCMAPSVPGAIAELADINAWLHRTPALAAHAAYFENSLSHASGNDPTLRLLQHELASRDPGTPMASRCAALEEAAFIARRIASGQAGLAQSLSAARVLRGWGERGLAVSTLARFIPAVLKGPGLSIDAPFIPPLVSYEAWPAELGNWVNAGIIEAAALWSAFSSYWGEHTTAPTVELLRRFGRQTAPFERRRQLRRIVEGRQARPEPHPLLQSKAPDNLNPGFWCGAPA